MRVASLLVGVAALAGAARADEIRLPMTADVSICMHEGERDHNTGRSPRLKMKGVENVILLNFDAAKLRGLVVEKASLRMRGTARNMMVRKVGVSTVATLWNEGAQTSQRKAAAGEATFLLPGGSVAWGREGDSTFLDAVWGRGGTIWAQSYVAPDAQQWYAIDIDPRLVEACAAGLSHGLAVSDDNGQTMNVAKEVFPETNHSNNYFFSREQAASAPELIVQAGVPLPRPALPVKLDVAVKPWPGARSGGGVEISFPSPGHERDTLGYSISIQHGDRPLHPLARWQTPTVARAGETARVFLDGLPAGTGVRAKVDIISRPGRFIASAQAEGVASRGSKAAPRLVPGPVTREAGDAPANAAARVFAIPDLAKANPVTGNVMEDPAARYEGDAGGTWARSNPAWSGKSGTIHLSGLRGEWVAFQLVCENKASGPVEYKIIPGALTDPGGATIAAEGLQFSRLWYQRVGAGEGAWYADPMLPLAAGASFTVPDVKNAIANQKNQTVYAELFVPRDAAAGEYRGALTVRANEEPMTLNVSLTVAPPVMPDAAAFVWSMNAYHSPGRDFGKDNSPEFIAAERAFYAMAHAHRTTLAVLHYSHAGDHDAGTTPPLAGTGKAARVADWTAWDARFAPLFDGSAFKGTPREKAPLDHFYLPFAEHWPTPMSAYKWNKLPWEKHWQVAGPIHEGFDATYKETWSAVAADFMRHFAERKWSTRFQVYLNDKYYYKQFDPKRGRAGRGVSFWLLDEPVHVDDFAALAFFGGLFRDAQKLAGSAGNTALFRADISRPQFGRDITDGVIDLNVTGGFAEHRPLLESLKDRHGQALWTYGGAPPSTRPASAIATQAIDLYSRGVDGFVPWLVLGSEKNWTEFAATTVFYVGKPHGIAGPCASLRLKAYRRGEQDVEYLKLLAAKWDLTHPHRRQLEELSGAAPRPERSSVPLDNQGATVESIGNVPLEALEAFRGAIVRELGK